MTAFITKDELKKRFPLSMKINSPKDFRKLPREKLPVLAEEYRDYLIEVCAKNGGHIGASLGTIELCFALHRVFESPKDKILWDIGHQAYPHKMLTGRFERMQGLRQEGGVSGFLRRAESEHDIIGAGHAGTSLSSAIGVCEGLRRKKDPHKVIAVIGDAALTAGMAYEALHQSVDYKKNLIVILNDNEMSISPNVGAVRAFLSRKMSSPFVHNLQADLKSALSKIPIVGDDVVEILSRVKHSIKHMIIPTVVFESFGFRYVGPVDGHNIEGLMETLNNIKDRDEPILIHVITEKGRGYPPAIADKVTFHGCGPYERATGKLIKKPAPIGYNKAFSQSLLLMAKSDPKIVAITGAMSLGTALNLFEKELPGQFYDVGISEQHAVTFAGGLAIEGQKPYAVIYSTFLQRGYDQVIHDICVQNLNVKFCMDRAGFVGADGATHHGNYDISYLRAIPNMTCCAPRDERELQELLMAMDKHIGPSAIRYPRGSGTGVSMYEKVEDIPEIPWGTGVISYLGGSVLKGKQDEKNPRAIPIEWVERLIKNNRGKVDMVLTGYGTSVNWCIEAAKKLSEEHGIQALVVNARFAKPIDQKLFKRVVKLSQKMVIVEEHVLNGGFGSAVLEFYERENMLSGLQIKRLGVPDRFFHQASATALYKEAGIDIDSIITAARKLAGLRVVVPKKRPATAATAGARA